MKYVILCGGLYPHWETPRQLLEIQGEPIVKRTIRLLRENGINDIAITTNTNDFNSLGVEIIRNNNPFIAYVPKGCYWVDAFPCTYEPVCYLLGDVVYSPEAIKTIIDTPTDSIEFFASKPPFDKRYTKPWAEPFAFKVVDTKRFNDAIIKTKQLQDAGKFARVAIAWELWQVIKDTPLNLIDYNNYVAINDYTCDVDKREDIGAIERAICQNI